MKTQIAILCVLAGFILNTAADTSQFTGQLGPFPAILILDDMSGVELKDKHGIVESSSTDLMLLRDAVITSRQMVRLFHDIVDEDGKDNEAQSLEFHPFGEPSPVVPLLRGTLTAMQKQKGDYDAQRAVFQRKLRSYALGMQADIENFMRGVATQQMETAARFDEVVRTRNGKDYNHSDVANAVLSSVKALNISTGLRVLVLNTDMEDLPFHGEPRSAAFTAAELPEDIVLLFVNSSRKPDNSPLFRKTANAKHHADSMAAAMALITTWLKQPDLAHPVTASAAP